ncbi:restriction endonuclease fold toxin 5 domain-containing protein [Burkholderia multivorans]|uniref:restriction endonuclease fold toxin 5 domain-containing protein n=2 Tax=Burkholderia multivorans TaxID=87883 RepID=UPI0021C0595F|nr:restriction endonuclease fold toxin 5 domain-containing protein [Burkholderia multivorans]
MVVPIVEAAAVELGPLLARAGVALLDGAAVAGTASLSGDTPKDQSKATPDVRAVPRTGESCKKCPPEGGRLQRMNHGVNWTSYRYQARITGFAFDTAECRWSDEWVWEGVDFDGFQREACLLQETKGDYDQFLDEDGDLSVISWARHIMGCKSHGYADEEEKANRSASGSGPRAAA